MNWKPRDPGNCGVPHRPGAVSSGTSEGEAHVGTATDANASAERPRARVFIGIKVAPEIAGNLATAARSLEAYPVRFVRPADIHLTLVPPWIETDVGGAVETLRNAVRPFGNINLAFEHLQYGPTLDWPRILWAECALSDDLRALQKHLMAIFGQTDERPFRPHVTLVRIPKNARSIAQKNPIDRKLSQTQQVLSIELFQSPKQANRGYEVIASVPLGDIVDRASSGEVG